jgi:hypothetical protein
MVTNEFACPGWVEVARRHAGLSITICVFFHAIGRIDIFKKSHINKPFY